VAALEGHVRGKKKENVHYTRCLLYLCLRYELYIFNRGIQECGDKLAFPSSPLPIPYPSDPGSTRVLAASNQWFTETGVHACIL
jgi:hypothetical protein